MLPLLFALLLVRAPASAADITTCGQAVGAGEVGELRADLVCDPLAIAVHLQGDGTLRLNGFTIAGGGQRTGAGVEVSGARRTHTTLEGPGEIRNFAVGVAGGGGSLVMRDLRLRANGYGLTYKAPVLLELDRVVADENDVGLSSRGGRMRGHDVEASHNTTAGVWAGSRCRFVRLTATGNGGRGGVYGSVVTRLVDSAVTGNDGLGAGYDVLSSGRVRFVRTTCGRAARVDDTLTVTRPLRCE